ncbi:hypothetical protein, partial [Deinococcus frigens]|uniref:hypothetical protein n=1 Tax=Deinococcus frigens TaxID=249403 RepID=UPI00049792D2
MAYQAKLKGGQTVVLENQGDQTVIRVSSGGQRQSSSATTGAWKESPTLFQTDDGAVVEVHTGDGSVYFQLGQGQLHSLDQAPPLEGARHLELEDVADGTGQSEMKPMTPMKPLKPMQPM